MDGIFFINKEQGMTTRKLDNLVGKAFNVKKVGHLGTLDPLASGLVLVGIGEGTKFFPFLEDLEKTYTATFKLGLLTSTLDLEGKVISQEDVEEVAFAELETIIKSFKGQINQIPPLTSAIKVGGVPLYKYAHKNIDVEVPSREVFVHDIKLIEYNHPFFTITTKVSKGTYIRTLGNDIAKLLNTVATTTMLNRDKIGDFVLDKQLTLANLTINDLVDPALLISHITRLDLDKRTSRDVIYGKTLVLEQEEELLALYFENVLLAIYEKHGEFYSCKRGFNLWKSTSLA